MDLSAFAGNDFNVDFESTHEIFFRFCGPVTRPDCFDKGLSACYVDSIADEMVLPLAKWEGNQPRVSQDENNLIQLVFTNAKSNNYEPITIFSLVCSDELDIAANVDHATSSYSVQINHPSFCNVPGKPGPSLGLIFSLIFGLMLFLWVVAGTAINVVFFKAPISRNVIPGLRYVFLGCKTTRSWLRNDKKLLPTANVNGYNT